MKDKIGDKEKENNTKSRSDKRKEIDTSVKEEKRQVRKYKYREVVTIPPC